MEKAAQDNRANQMNPNNSASGGAGGGMGGGMGGPGGMDKAATDNRANQMNPNNPAYHNVRGGKWNQKTNFSFFGFINKIVLPVYFILFGMAEG